MREVEIRGIVRLDERFAQSLPIEQLVKCGMQIALIDGAPQGVEQTVQAVNRAFETLNTPIGLMLDAQGYEPEAAARLALRHGMQYVLMPSPEAAGELDGALKGELDQAQVELVIPVGEAHAAQALGAGGTRGVLVTGDWPGMTGALIRFRAQGGLVFLGEEAHPEGTLYADGLVVAKGTSPAELAHALVGRAELERDGARGYLDPERTLSEPVERARELVAAHPECAAVLALTDDGDNIASLAALDFPVPLIVISNRVTRTPLLLRLIGRRGAVPTAITRVPGPEEREAFARMVAGLYGFKQGGFVLTGSCWPEAPEAPTLWIDLATPAGGVEQ